MRSSRESSSISSPEPSSVWAADRVTIVKPLLEVASLLAVAGISLTGCRNPGVQFHEDNTPRKLSDWGLLEVRSGVLELSPRVLPYELNSTLFTDYAHKLRTVWLPENTEATIAEDGSVELPVGTILSKTFYYPLATVQGEGVGEGPLRVARIEQASLDFPPEGMPLEGKRLIETRLLVHRSSGWATLPYVWNEAQTEAELEIVGADIELELVAQDAVTQPSREPFLYFVPDANQCSGCHVTDHSTKKPLPIGLKIRHLNRDVRRGGESVNQLALWASFGYLPVIDPAGAPRAAISSNPATGSLEERARAYLDVNCGHCHNPKGAGDTSGLFLDAATTEGRRLGICKPPIAAGRGSGNRLVSIHPGQPEKSIMPFRMASTDPGIAMPELGRSTVHREGVELIAEWIGSLEGECERVLATGL